MSGSVIRDFLERKKPGLVPTRLKFSSIPDIMLFEISQVTITKNRISQGWDLEKRQILRACLETEMILPSRLKAAIEELIRETGRQCFMEHTEASAATVWPDHTRSPGAFAWAIHHGGFSAAEVGQIKFDHGETLSSFAERERETIVADIRAYLLPT